MKSTKITIGIIVFIIFCVGAGILIANKNSDTGTASTDTPVTATVPTTPTSAPHETTNPGTPVATTPASSLAYKNGTYAATGSYDSPAGMENVGVSVTVANDVITDATVTNEAQDHTSSRYQNMFISGYRSYVVGKKLSDVSVGKISGSSLTGNGFNAALAKIKSQAKA